MVHTTESMLRDKTAINQMPHVADDLSEEFGNDSDEDDDLSIEDAMNIGGDAYPSSSTTFPGWALDKECNPAIFNASIIRQVKAIQQALQSVTNPGIKSLLQAHLDSLQLHKLQNLRQGLDVDTIRQDVNDLKELTLKKFDEKLPEGTMKELLLN